MSNKALKAALEKLMERELIVIQAYSKSEDMTGHIDGMLRFVDENTLVGNAVEENDTDLKNDVVRLQKDYGLKYISLPYFEDPFNQDKRVPTDKRISAKGIYVNFLKIDEIILFPVFKEPGFEEYDKEAEKVMIKAFPTYKIVPIHINEIAKQGGLINCISWVS
jgi:agmatine deiminase